MTEGSIVVPQFRGQKRWPRAELFSRLGRQQISAGGREGMKRTREGRCNAFTAKNENMNNIVAHKLVLDFQLCALESYFQCGSQFLFGAKSFALHKVTAINVRLYYVAMQSEHRARNGWFAVLQCSLPIHWMEWSNRFETNRVTVPEF